FYLRPKSNEEVDMRYVLPAILIFAALQTPTVEAQGRGVGRAGTGTPVAPNPNDLPPPTVKPEDKCSIEGTVVSAATGEPLKKAHLSLRPMNQRDGTPYGTTTDNAGHFVIDNVDPGRYSFSASRNGFVMESYSPHGNLRQTAPV